MPDLSPAARAAYNNAVWCDTMCRAHGRPGAFLDGIWINRRPSPPFYPNAVTLQPQVGGQLAAVQTLLAARLPGEWAVKDSFCALDLAPLGFRVLFSASWIYRPAALPPPAGAIPGVRWRQITAAPALAAWEWAWQGGNAAAGSARLFRPALLADRNVAILAAYQGEKIVAGAIASRSGDVVGLSNVFVPVAKAARFWAGCVAAARRAFPGLPLAGYEAGDDLAPAKTAGFTAVGPLRVWVNAAPT